MSREAEDLNRRLLRARDAMDRAYAEPLDVGSVAAVAHVSQAHFIRSFRSVFGETPHRYLQRRRVERSMFLLRETGLTKGNLSSHLAKLEEAAYVKIEKSFRGKVPLTTVSLTKKGQDAVREYRERMRRALETMPERRTRP